MVYVAFIILVIGLFACIVFAKHSGEIADEMAEKAHNTEEYCKGLQLELAAAKEELEVLRAESASRIGYVYEKSYRDGIVKFIQDHPSLSSKQLSEKTNIPASTIRRWRREANKN